jgi:hypothetical protein
VRACVFWAGKMVRVIDGLVILAIPLVNNGTVPQQVTFIHPLPRLFPRLQKEEEQRTKGRLGANQRHPTAKERPKTAEAAVDENNNFRALLGGYEAPGGKVLEPNYNYVFLPNEQF